MSKRRTKGILTGRMRPLLAFEAVACRAGCSDALNKTLAYATQREPACSTRFCFLSLSAIILKHLLEVFEQPAYHRCEVDDVRRLVCLETRLCRRGIAVRRVPSPSRFRLQRAVRACTKKKVNSEDVIFKIILFKGFFSGGKGVRIWCVCSGQGTEDATRWHYARTNAVQRV